MCDEYETVETLKSRILTVLSEINFKLPRQEEELTTEDIKLNLEMRVSNFHIIVSTLII